MASIPNRFRIAAASVGGLLALAVGLLAWQIWSWERAERLLTVHETEEKAGRLASAVADRLGDFVRSIDFALLEIRREYGVDDARFRAISDGLLKALPDGSVQQFGTANHDGVLTYSSLGLSGQVSIRDRDHFTVHRDGVDRLYISKPLLGRVSKKWSIQFSRPILRQGQFAGVVVISIAPEFIGQVLASAEAAPQDIVSLFDESGNFISRSHDLAAILGRTLPPGRPFLGPDAAERGIFHVTAISDGVERITAWKRVRGSPLIAAIGLGKQAALAPIERHFNQIWRGAIAASAALFAVGAGIIALLIRVGRQQQSLAASEAQFRAIFEQAAVGVGVVGAHDGRWLRVNQKLCDIVGYGERELLASTFLAITHPDDRELHLPNRRRVEAGEIASYTLEKRFVRRDGNVVWINLASSIIRDARGAPDCFIAVCEDITDRKLAEQRLAEANAGLERRVAERTAEANEQARLIEQIHDAVLTTDMSGRITSWNKGAERMFRATAGEAIGRNMRNFYAPEVRGTINRLIRDESVATGWFETETRGLRADGTAFDLLVSTSLLRDPAGTVTGYVGFGIDVSDRRRAQAVLLEAKEAAERANAAKSEFLARMSHELRTPLNAILGFAQLLVLEIGEGRANAEIHEILRAGRHLLQLVNDLLDLSRIESGHLEVTLESVDLGAAIEASVALVAPSLSRESLSLDTDLGDCRGALLLADATRLRQVLVNLLGNAVKYNQPGGTIRLQCLSVAAGSIRIEVIDSGLGIAPERMGQLFRPFERIAPHAGGVEGAGIGLALSRQLVEAMGGRIGASSTPGKGSTFWIELPTSGGSAPAEAERREPPAESAARALKVLYIEDNAANVRLMQQVLERIPLLELYVAARGETGVELAQSRAPDLVLLDMNLPDIDGFEVLRRLRALSSLAAVPVFAVSADAMPRDVQRAMAAGVERYFTKPFNVAELMDALRAMISAKGEEAPSTGPGL